MPSHSATYTNDVGTFNTIQEANNAYANFYTADTNNAAIVQQNADTQALASNKTLSNDNYTELGSPYGNLNFGGGSNDPNNPQSGAYISAQQSMQQAIASRNTLLQMRGQPTKSGATILANRVMAS